MELPENKEQAIQYLLGELVEYERDAFEDKLFADENLSLFLDKTEDDLVDEYVSGKINAALLKRFEAKYLNSERRREKLRFAKTLQQKLTQDSVAAVVETAPQTSWFDFLRFPKLVFAGGLATLLLMILIGGILLRSEKNNIVANSNNNLIVPINTPIVQTPAPNIVVNTNQSKPNTDSNLEIKKEANTNLKTKNDNENAPRTNETKPKVEEKPVVRQSPGFATLILLPTMRSGGKQTLNIKSETKQIYLKIVSDNAQDFSNYKIEVRDSNGTLVSRQSIKNNSQKISKMFQIILPATKLVNGLYEVTLNAIEKDGTEKTLNFYEFNLVKKYE